jgi:H+/Cl- antiporter ClcA
MSEKSLIRRSPNSIAVLIALAFALLTITGGVVLLLAIGLRHSSWSVDSKAVMSDPESGSAFHFPALVLLAAICLLLLPLLWRYRHRAKKPGPPEL